MTARPLHQQYIIYKGTGTPGGGGGNDPDPAEFCPTHGYVDPTDPEVLAEVCPIGGYYPDPLEEFPEEWPPLYVPTGDEEITLIVSNEMVYEHDIIPNAGEYPTIKVYGYGNVLLDTRVATTTRFSFALPSSGGYINEYGINMFSVVVYMNTGVILSPVFYCAAYAANIKLIRNILAYRTFPNMFRYAPASYIRYCEFHPDVVAGRLDWAFYYTSKLDTVKLPKKVGAAGFSSAGSMSGVFYLSSVRKIILPTDMTEVTDMNQAFRDTKKLTTPLDFPPLPMLTSLKYAFSATTAPRVRFSGVSDACTEIDYMLFSSTGPKELILPTSMNAITGTKSQFIANNSTSLEKVVMPQTMNNAQSFQTAFSNIPTLLKITMPLTLPAATALSNFITGTTQNISILTDCTFSLVIDCLGFATRNTKITALNWTSLKVSRITFTGISAVSLSPLTSLNIDWANSVFIGDVLIQNNSMDATELNRIMSALPSVSPTRTLNMTGNPGYATCDKTIAQAKGWTVL